ncbi:MAG: tRNA-uridine aminocarboxypropyltransferase [Burkholderiaceae bacterium]
MKRFSCTVCLRAQSSCICHWVTPVASNVEVLILQHPLEVHEAKGTARLLHLCLPNSRLVSGEVFDATLFDSPKQSILLYPETPPDPSLGLLAPPALDPNWLVKPAQLRLVVLDGTWRKSRKMLYLNPRLQQMPRMALQNLPTSAYSIRKAHKADQLSTLEATCAALMQLEGHAVNTVAFVPLLAAFAGFVSQLVSQQAGFNSKQV